MEVLDPGHDYLLASFDGGEPIRLTFVKRNDPPEKYPGNTNAYPGTQIQEVLAALLERMRYVDQQVPCEQTQAAIEHIAKAFWLLEQRHAERHGVPDSLDRIGANSFITQWPRCSRCGHIACFCEPALAPGAGSGGN